jgi:hypothetical protein
LIRLEERRIIDTAQVEEAKGVEPVMARFNLDLEVETAEVQW